MVSSSVSSPVAKGVASPVGLPFIPPLISSNALWLDAADTSTITESASDVSQWDDKSGSDNHALQGTAIDQPQTGTRTINNHNVIDFVGSSEHLMLTSDITSTDYSYFLVMAVDDDANTKAAIGGTTAGAPRVRISAAENIIIQNQGSGALITSSTSLTDGVGYQVSATTGAAGSALWIDGGAEGTDGTDPAYTEALNRIGKGGGNLLNGAIGEVIIYDRIVTTAERLQIETYLRNKWGTA